MRDSVSAGQERGRERKQDLRREMLRKLRAEREDVAQVLNSAEGLPRWGAARHILAYLPLPHEVPLRPLLRSARLGGKALYLPRVEGTGLVFRRWDSDVPDELELERAAWGGMEPAALAPVWDSAVAAESLVIVPGLAFTIKGGRLGRGGGFYDRFLAANTSLYSIAICFSFQICAQIPLSAHDMPIDQILFPVS